MERTYPEQTEADGRSHVPLIPESDDEAGEEKTVSDHLFAVVEVRAFVEAIVVDSLVKDLVLASNLSLDNGIQGGVGSKILLGLAGNGGVSYTQCC